MLIPERYCLESHSNGSCVALESISTRLADSLDNPVHINARIIHAGQGSRTGHIGPCWACSGRCGPLWLLPGLRCLKVLASLLKPYSPSNSVPIEEGQEARLIDRDLLFGP